jgi:hypothetical protein
MDENMKEAPLARLESTDTLRILDLSVLETENVQNELKRLETHIENACESGQFEVNFEFNSGCLKMSPIKRYLSQMGYIVHPSDNYKTDRDLAISWH